MRGSVKSLFILLFVFYAGSAECTPFKGFCDKVLRVLHLKRLAKPQAAQQVAEVLVPAAPVDVPEVQTFKDGVPILTSLPFEEKSFSRKKPYREYKMQKKFDSDSKEYQDFQDHSIEIIYTIASISDHISLRVGRKFYSLNYKRSASIHEFSPNHASKGQMGYVFLVDPKTIEAAQVEMEKFYESSRSDNIPAFDINSTRLQVIETKKKNAVKYESNNTSKYAALKDAEGSIVKEGENSYLISESGYKLPLTEENGNYYCSSYNCSSSATMLIEKFLGIDITDGWSAGSLMQNLAGGNRSGSQAPFAIIDYAEVIGGLW